ncbi:phosphoenolpyruvate--protein phosphotransferase [Microterricola pindariensis]|uniref:Phosphoenolpyruvate-protein phosphotransferase n=1 Tax=Microterricola pindariensis TaxID=478010 RepID=A0ABX5AYQ1_9MICO|nr:phosphoenolpyruvate--protein phosphotransferase [Microterricola pindariensis]PPL20017.1 phosphoenolpyruvate--protein phosphotransferase [Microterricola pindariensis]
MNVSGTGIGSGIAIGRVVRMPEPLPEPVDRPSALSPAAEKARAAEALAAVAAELRRRGEQAGGAAAEVLEAQAMFAEDPMLESDLDARVDAGKTAERAVHEAYAAYRAQLLALGGYMAERATDVDDVSQRVIAELLGQPAPGVPDPGHPFILVARDLAPADTATLDLEQVLALVTIGGGPTSHTAILARDKAIVAIVAADGASVLRDGDEVIVDAENDLLVTDPTPQELADAEARRAARAARLSAPLTPGALADGTPVPLLANLGSADAAGAALAAGAEGVGLFRTEFLFLDAATAPTVAEQQLEYGRLLQAFDGKKVVVRVLDAGADKPLAFLDDGHEDNPALGLRGIRALRAHEEILRDQLSALAAADAETNADLWVMAPMVSTVEEAEYFSALAHELGIRVAGVMVEVPSAALLADRILRASDFASIGTNDLTQYTLAADRLLGTVAALQSPWNPAVLRLIAEVGAAGRASGKPVGICGEAAADPLLAVVLVGLGATTLSMSPAAIADVRASLLRFDSAQAAALAEAALSADGAAEAHAAARAYADGIR